MSAPHWRFLPASCCAETECCACCTRAGAEEGGGAAAALRLTHIIAAADAAALQDVLCACAEGVPFLLQPLVDAPSLLQVLPAAQPASCTQDHLAVLPYNKLNLPVFVFHLLSCCINDWELSPVLSMCEALYSTMPCPWCEITQPAICGIAQGDPAPRLLRVAGLLRDAAALGGDAAVAAMAASAVQGLMFTSVCRGFISGAAHGPAPPQRGPPPSPSQRTTEVSLTVSPFNSA